MAKRILTCTIMTSRFCGRCLRPHTVELFATFSVSDVKPFFTCCVLASNTWNCVGNVSRAAIRSPHHSRQSGPAQMHGAWGWWRSELAGCVLGVWNLCGGVGAWCELGRTGGESHGGHALCGALRRVNVFAVSGLGTCVMAQGNGVEVKPTPWDPQQMD